MNKITLICIFLAVSFFGACAAPQKEPVWLGKTWQEGSKFFFSGISGECSTLQESKEQAYINAMIKAAEYVGVSVNTKTKQTLTNDGADLESLTGLSAEEVFLTQASIKEFVYNKTEDKMFTGYILIEYNKNLLEEEKKRRDELERQRLQKIADRKKLGALSVKMPAAISSINGEVKHFLQQQGYITGEEGTPLVFTLVDENYSVSMQSIFVCGIKIDIQFKDDVKSYSSTGFGKDKGTALGDALKQWMEEFKTKYSI